MKARRILFNIIYSVMSLKQPKQLNMQGSPIEIYLQHSGV